MVRYITEELSLYATFRDLSHTLSKSTPSDYSTSALIGLFLTTIALKDRFRVVGQLRVPLLWSQKL